jgi:hypothetical protein
MDPTLFSLALNNRLLSTVLTAVWILVNPSLIHSNKSKHKISFIFVKTLQALLPRFSCECVLDLWASAAPILRKACSYPILHAKYIPNVLLKCLYSQQFHPPVIQ